MRTRVPLLAALLLCCLGMSAVSRAQSQYAHLSVTVVGKKVTVTVTSAISYGGGLYFDFKTSLGTKLSFETYRNSFSPLPFQIGFDENQSNAQRDLVGKFFYFDSADANAPYYGPVQGTITITAFDAAAKAVSGTFTFTLKRVGFNLPEAERGKTVSLTEGRFTNVVFKQM